MNAHDFLRNDLHLFPLHLHERLKGLVERAHREGAASAAPIEGPCTPDVPPTGTLATAQDLLIAQRASTDAINAGVEERRAKRSARPPKGGES